MSSAGSGLHRIDPLVGIKRALRLYSRLISDLDRRLASSPRSQPERRILLELLHRAPATDADIAAALGMSGPQLSRTMAKLISEDLVKHGASSSHRRQRHLSLTETGQAVAGALNKQLEAAIEREIEELSSEDQSLIAKSIGGGPGEAFDEKGSYTIELRKPKPADYPWLLREVGSCGESYGWGEASIAHGADVIRRFIGQSFGDSRMGFVAHRLGSPVGACLFIFDGEDGLHAQIGVLYVAPQARGVGIGNKLLAASISQARELELLSVSAELSERQTDLDHLYQTQGLVRSRRKTSDCRFGRQENWRRYILKLPLVRPSPKEDAEDTH
ncbi:MAG TPA: helix-turn-helix domain-containing GNAT family N-acetyltransferase [Allosphingosinicella sp.]|nr:helix-turn-helix domain-containing GNAT family N-acetyltransferase [Allosphingosinicella sp.]